MSSHSHPHPVSLGNSTLSQYPCALYHRNKEAILVKNKAEMDDAFMQGYSMSPSGITQKEVLEMKRVTLVEELRELDEALRRLSGADVENELEEEELDEADALPNLLASTSSMPGPAPADPDVDYTLPPPPELPQGVEQFTPPEMHKRKPGNPNWGRKHHA